MGVLIFSHFWLPLNLYQMLKITLSGSCVWQHKWQWLIIWFETGALYIIQLIVSGLRDTSKIRPIQPLMCAVFTGLRMLVCSKEFVDMQ